MTSPSHGEGRQFESGRAHQRLHNIPFLPRNVSLTDRIAEIEEEISSTKYNKVTQHHIGKLKAKLAQLREQVVAQSSGPKGSGYGVRKAGDATVAIVGLPSVGKSTLLARRTERW